MIHAEVAPLEVLAQLGDDAREDEVLGERIEAGDVHHVHAAVGEAAPGQVVSRAIVGHEALGPGRDVAQTVADFPDRGEVVRFPDLATLAQNLHKIEDRAEELLEVREALHQERLSPQHVVLILPPDDALGEEVDEGVGLGVHVVAVEHHLGVVQHLAEAPDERVRCWPRAPRGCAAY